MGSSGVRIKGAIVEGSVELSNEKIPYAISLVSCTFKSPVIFFNVKIAGDLNISSSFETFDSLAGADRRCVDVEPTVIALLRCAGR